MSEYREYIVRLSHDWANKEGEKLTEIVRCRDCKRYHPKEGQMLSCRFEYEGFVQWRSAEPDGFCAWAERKEGGDD